MVDAAAWACTGCEDGDGGLQAPGKVFDGRQLQIADGGLATRRLRDRDRWVSLGSATRQVPERSGDTAQLAQLDSVGMKQVGTDGS